MTFHKYRVTVANKTHDIRASCAAEALDIAQERWGTWPDHIEKIEED